MSIDKEIVVKLFESIMRPLARILMRFGVSAPEAADVTRWSFVRSFYETRDFWRYDKPTAIQCALKTGISRAEVGRLAGMATPLESINHYRMNRSARVIEGWLNDPEFHANGAPAALPIRSIEPPSFNRLCRRYAGDVNTDSVLDDLVAAECVRVEGNTVMLVDSTYGLRAVDKTRVEIFAFMTSQLIETSDFNLLQPDTKQRHLQRYWCQRFIPEDSVSEIRAYMHERSVEAGRDIERYMVERSHSERREGTRYTDMGICMFMFEDAGNETSTIEQESKPQ